MQPLIEHRMAFAGTSTRVLELEGSGPPLVLLHGYGDSADTWRLLLDDLRPHDRAAYAVDLPGFGEASPLGPELIVPQLVAFASAVVRHAAAEHGQDVVIVGNSLGGLTAMLLAEDPSLPLAGIVPVAPAGLDMARWFVILERDPIVRTLVRAPIPVPETVVKLGVGSVFRQLAFARPGEAPGEIVGMFAHHHRSLPRVKRVLDTGRRLLPELRDPFDLSAIRCPVLLVWGTRDRMVFRTGAERVLETVPDARLEVLDGLGHCLQLEDPGALLELVLPFPTPMAAPGSRRRGPASRARAA